MYKYEFKRILMWRCNSFELIVQFLLDPNVSIQVQYYDYNCSNFHHI